MIGSRTSRRASGVLAPVISLTLMIATAPAADFNFRGLGPTPDDPNGRSNAYAVSADGMVVVGMMMTPDQWGGLQFQAFRWTTATGIVGLGFLEGGTYSGARGVSADGSVVVGSSNTTARLNRSASFRWTASEGMVRLADTLVGHGPIYACDALGVSADGVVVVGGANLGGSEWAYRWTAEGGMVSLGALPGGTGSTALGVSADGSVVVGSAPEAFRWTASEEMVALGTIPGGPNISFARAVSASGSVVVGGIGSAPDEGFRWTAESGMVALGDVPGGSEADPLGVSGDGSIVVGEYRINSTGQAFIWDRDHGMRDLRDVLASDYGLDLTGWVLNTATAISPDGKTIVGWGRHDNKQEAFVARIGPIPVSSDFNHDGDVDLGDFGVLQLCFNGPNQPPTNDCMVDADLDGDADVDLNDFMVFQSCFNGPNNPPACE